MTQEHLRARTIRRLATKACKTQCNYAPSDDTGTPSSQNYNGGTLRAQTMESHFPTSMKSAPHIRDILATRITMISNDPGSDHEIAFPNEYEVHNAHRRHLCDQNYNGGTIRAQTMEAHFPTSMKSAAHIRDNLATRITMGERSGQTPRNCAFPNEYEVHSTHWRHPSRPEL